MEKGTLRKVQPAHKSDRLTVREARNAWLKVESETEADAPTDRGAKAEVTYKRPSRRPRKKKTG